jgi:hypothetical protein
VASVVTGAIFARAVSSGKLDLAQSEVRRECKAGPACRYFLQEVRRFDSLSLTPQAGAAPLRLTCPNSCHALVQSYPARTLTKRRSELQ